MTRTPRIVLVGLAAFAGMAGLVLTGCGSDEAATTTTVAFSPTTQAPGGTADDASDSSSSDAAADVCAMIAEGEVGALVGGTVTVESDSGGGCTFNQEDLRAPAISFNTSDVGSDNTDGTFNAARVGAFATLTDPTKEDPDIGDYSVVASGTIAGGESQAGVGLVQVGPTLVQVTVLQGTGMDAAAVLAMSTQALTLAASKL